MLILSQGAANPKQVDLLTFCDARLLAHPTIVPAAPAAKAQSSWWVGKVLGSFSGLTGSENTTPTHC